MCFAQRILSTELYNDCIDLIRQHFRLKAEQGQAESTAIDIVSVSDVSLAYDALLEQPHLRFCLCFELALQTNQKIINDVTTWMNADLSQLLQDGGDFASDFPKLLAYCSSKRLVSGAKFAANYNWLYHIGGSPPATNGGVQPKTTNVDTTLIKIVEDAADIFDKKIRQHKTTVRPSEKGSGH
ncbi:MAG: hypothetical protein Q9224_006069 [Gallowayella concinna]